jgi:hypothetical protein
MRSDARERRESLQPGDDLLYRASSSHANPSERFAECCERSLGDDRESSVTNRVDRARVGNHEDFATHALAARSVAFHVEACRRASPLGAIVMFGPGDP